MSSSPRADWVDCARSLAMFFIVWLHADAAPDWVGKPVGGGIALFYLLAGYFLPRVVGQALVRTGRLALAWGLWSLLSLGLMAVFAPDFEFSWQRAIGWGVAAYNTPLWFLKTLVCYQLVAVVLLAVRLLPRYAWLLAVVALLGSYVVEPAQHESVRFDYFWVFLLGCSLRSFSLESLETYLWKNGWILGCAALVVLFQPLVVAAWAGGAGVGWHHCSLPVAALAYMLLYLLAGVVLGRVWPQLSFCGRWMLFIYASHSFMLAPLYGGCKVHIWWNLWVPLCVLPLLAWAGCALSCRFPRVMALLLAKPWR